MTDLNIILAGAAGQGVQSAAAILGKTLLRLGFYVFTTMDYQSRVRGGHNFMRIRFSNSPLGASVRRVNYLLALNEESLRMHLPDLVEGGFALCMEQDKGDNDDPRVRPLPKTVGPKEAQGEKFVGVKLLSMLFTMTGFEPDVLKNAIKSQFGKKLKEEVLQANMDAAEAVSEYVSPVDIQKLQFTPVAPESHMLINGNDAIALGMIAAGIGVYVGYPMTPSTTVMNLLAANGPKIGIAVEQVEDEICAINAAIGASYTGARTATGSSGGGISLMSEGIGLAGVTETPVVIVVAQRPGPATGMATRTEQSDLLFVVHASQGEFPRAVLAPADHTDAFYLTAEAFNLADQWQVPVFIMDDQYFSDAECTVPEFDLSKVTIDRGAIADEPTEVAVLDRYALTDSGVSPRAFPLLSKWLVYADSHEHDPTGHVTDNLQNRNLQNEKRMKKLEGIRSTFPGPDIVGGPAKTLLLCWGSTVGPVTEAVPILKERGHDVAAAVFRHLFPMNVDAVKTALAGAEKLFTIEGNFSGQLGGLLRQETCIDTDGHIAKYDGRPFTVEDVVALVEQKLGGKS